MNEVADVSVDVHAHLTRVVDATAAILGFAERWVAPVALIDAPAGFGEESWIHEIPDSLIAVALAGAPVSCEWGPGVGRRSRGLAPTLQPAGTPNHFRAIGAVRFAQIYLPEHLINRVADALKPGSRAATHLRDDLVFHEDAELTARTRHYLSAAMNGRESSGLEMEARAILLVARLLSHHGYVSPANEIKGGLAPWQISRIDAFLSDAPEQSITLDALAGQVGLSPFHFARAFKASKGVPPHRYLVQLRIDRARDLLESTDLPIIEISAKVGYDDPSYLARLFRREVGITPAAYRRERLR
jgi:AraC family transcriptional regulator